MRAVFRALILIGAVAHADAPIEGHDYHSFANVDQFRVVHLDLALDVDFKEHVLRGSVTLEIKRLDPHATQLLLDTRDLHISSVTQQSTDVTGATSATSAMEPIWVSRPFQSGRTDPILGSPLIIELPRSARAMEFIKIEYETSPAATALQWLSPPQTAGKHQPFLYTQFEPTGTRSWIPLQDTPQVRVTYRAVIQTPDELLAVMSAQNDPKARHTGEFEFAMSKPVASYLIALAVGDLKFKATGVRTGVYAEGGQVKAAALEFADTEAMLQVSTKLLGPYRWERYDIVVLPPGYPGSGMQYPRLSFMPATLSRPEEAQVLAYPMAHSWSGNLVTNATWGDVWLNEGFSSYLESRIVEAVEGPQRASMEAVLGLASLREELATLKEAVNANDSLLAVDMRARDPRAAYTSVASEKGRLFLRYLEIKVGRVGFDEFLRAYFDKFQFQSLTTEQFLAYCRENLLSQFPAAVNHSQLMAWFTQPGIPADAVIPASDVFIRVDTIRVAWLANTTLLPLDLAHWVTPEWLHFFKLLPVHLSALQMTQLERALVASRNRSPEVEQAWLMLVIRNDHAPGFTRLRAYLKSICRIKWVQPLYVALMQTPAHKEFAKRVYSEARPGYHSDTVTAIDAITNDK